MAPKEPQKPGQTTRPFGEAPEPDIPVLKEKEKERKGAGVPGYVGSSGGSGGFAGGMGAGSARVGSSLISQPGFLGSGRIAAAVSRALGGKATALGSLFSSKAGAPIVLGGMLSWGGLMAVAGLKLAGGGLGGLGQSISNASSSAFLGTPGSGMVIDKPKDRSLGYLAQANEGEIVWDKDDPNAPKEVEPKDAPAPQPEAEPVPAPEVPKFEMPDVSALEQNLDRDKFVKKMTNDVASLHGGGGLKQGTAGFDMKKSLGSTTFTPRKLQNGKAQRLARMKSKLRRGAMSTKRGHSSRAMGQLKLSRNMSVTGAQMAKDTSARQYSTDAFTQGRSIGGDLNSIEGGGVVVPPGSGLGYSASDINPPAVGPAGNVTPYQSQLDAAKQMGDNSAMLKMLGMMMIAIGIGLMAAGRALMGNHTTFPIGIALFGAGVAMVAMGMMMLAMSANMAGMAKDQGQGIEDNYGQNDQGTVVDECADQATNSGIDTENCNPTLREDHFQGNMTNSIQQDVSDERNATYEGLGDNGGVGIEDDVNVQGSLGYVNPEDRGAGSNTSE